MRFAVILMLSLIAAPVWASDVTRCVQNQLAAAGLNPGPVDGIVGGKTRRALAQFQQAEATVSTRRLTGATAGIYCRLIGLARPALAAHWPSRGGFHEFVFSDQIDAGFRSRIRASVASARHRLSEALDVELAHRPLIIVGETPTNILRLLRRNRGAGYQSARSTLDRICASETGIGGLAFSGIMVICRQAGASVPTDIEPVMLDHVILHEFVHLIQSELSGGSDSTMSDRTILRATGPIWLTEGSAEFISISLAYGVDHRFYQKEVLRLLQRDSVDLGQLERRAALRRDEDGVYLAGGAAAAEIARANGTRSLIQFYDLLGRGAEWTAAFEAAFSISPAALYACRIWSQRSYVGNCADDVAADGRAPQ